MATAVRTEAEKHISNYTKNNQSSPSDTKLSSTEFAAKSNAINANTDIDNDLAPINRSKIM